MEVVPIKKPNSLCKNEHCRKPFYACAYCTRTNAWRAVACSIECYNAYTDQVVAARAAKRKINLTPERTDLTEEQMQDLMNKPIEAVIEITKEELKDYADDIAAKGLGGTIDKINKEIRNAEAADAPDANAMQPVPESRRTRKKKPECCENAE